VRTISPHDVDIITRFTDGPIMVTVAPETVDDISLRNLIGAGVVVFAGHSDADHPTATRAFDTGVRGATHLFNAMSQMGSRSPGLVGATLAHGVAFAGIIADGFHVDAACVSVAAQSMPERLFLVTDAMQTLAGDSTSFNLYGKDITLTDGRLTDTNGTLAGAHLSMDQAVRNMIKMTGLPDTIALAMASTIPARAVGMDDQLGVIAPGYRAGLTLLTDDLHPAGTVVDGVVFS
jgi:N-acetylglucosamine-6-phosphate deacetylase